MSMVFCSFFERCGMNGYTMMGAFILSIEIEGTGGRFKKRWVQKRPGRWMTQKYVSDKVININTSAISLFLRAPRVKQLVYILIPLFCLFVCLCVSHKRRRCIVVLTSMYYIVKVYLHSISSSQGQPQIRRQSPN